jgi:uncharacterized protein YecT (DUF1311 family)
LKKILLLLLPFVWIVGCSSSSEKDINETNVAPTQEEAEDTEETASDPSGTKETYLNKLNEIEVSLKEFDKVYESGTQTDMNQAKSETFKRWDEALNEIYGVLKEQLSESEMEDLKIEQRDWIKQRDKIAEEKSKEAEGGTLEPFLYSSALADLTKERCYELVNNYMK